MTPEELSKNATEISGQGNPEYNERVGKLEEAARQIINETNFNLLDLRTLEALKKRIDQELDFRNNAEVGEE